MKPAIRELRTTASEHDSQFATPQARKLGLTANDLWALRKRGEIEQVRVRVWRFASAPADPDPAITAALLCWPDGVISHDSAARYHGLQRIKPPAAPHVTVPHGEVHRLPGVNVHWSRNLPACDILRVGGVGYTSLARTGCDLADPAKPWQTLAIVDDMMALGASRSWVHSRAAALANGRGGVRLVRDATHRDAAPEFRSFLERAAAHVYRVGGLPEPLWNARITDPHGVMLVDALWPTWRIISEKEGLRFHTTPSQRRRDARRFNRLQDAGYRPRRFTWEDVVQRPREVLETLYRALRAAGADLDPAQIPHTIVVPARPFAGAG